ncbi:MAG: class I SAM-dependent DNA methyltransferase [Devosia sp.]|nr:class I SAM-dependent DNA methyltransferase [Devosia sp.]
MAIQNSIDNESLNAARFIKRWADLDGGQERANYSLFLAELCDVIGVQRPDPARAAHEFNDYVFERRVERRRPDGTLESGRIDLYKRGCFILEAKQSRQRGATNAPLESQSDLFTEPRAEGPTTRGLDHVMIQARRQAERYATSLPPDHVYPPFIIACDVGRAIEIYADFSGYGRHYAHFPDANRFRINLAQLADPNIRQMLKKVWQAPAALDPAHQTAKVTREIAGQLAEVSKSLESKGYEPRSVAVFLMRCLFTMFVEDVGLLRKRAFTELLTRCLSDPQRFVFEIDDLWRNMDVGGYSIGVGERLLRFNGKLFKQATVLPLTREEIGLLRDASAADWRDLEPAIFGTLFEQALNPTERRQLGAHYTPRTYVERVVDTTIIDPLVSDWKAYQASADRASQNGMRAAAIRHLEDFLRHLCSVRVLDPACGTGNFLYVAMLRMKQMEGEALKHLHDLGGEEALERVIDISVKPDQFFGMELNKRAVEIAELVLWIGYIQWHMRTRTTPPPEPVLHSSDHVQEKDALLTWTGYPDRHLVRDLAGTPVTSRAGKELYTYPNPERPAWPEVDFIVGNPPFMGGKDIRGRLGSDYAEALWAAHPQVNPSADLVMYWWDRAAEILIAKNTRLRRFGFVTTNSITQVFQRRVLERHLVAAKPVSLVMAIPDHPWTKASKDAAAVRIAITVAEAGEAEGEIRRVVSEEKLDTDEPVVGFQDRTGRINPDLTIGADVTRAHALRSNDTLCSPGVKLHGDGFIISRAQAEELGLGVRPGLDAHIRPYRNGRDLMGHSRDALVIDLFDMAEEAVRREYPEVYQHLLETVRVARMEVYARSPTRDAQEYLQRWWQFGKGRSDLRSAMKGLSRYIATVETAKHRVFQFLNQAILPDNMLVAIAADDGFYLGVLSSRVHVIWALASGGTLEDRPRYSKSRCFDPFPFPDATTAIRSRIAALAEELDATRKLVLSEHPDLTLTALYNSIEVAKGAKALPASNADIHQRGRIPILKRLHEQLDEAVFAAYGWSGDTAEDEILNRLVALNHQRADEERRGFIKWLRPDYQIDRLGPLAHRADRIQTLATVAGKAKKSLFPTTERDQARVVLQLIERSREPMSAEEIAALFSSRKLVVTDVQEVLKSLNRLGLADTLDNGQRYYRSVS